MMLLPVLMLGLAGAQTRATRALNRAVEAAGRPDLLELSNKERAGLIRKRVGTVFRQSAVETNRVDLSALSGDSVDAAMMGKNPPPVNVYVAPPPPTPYPTPWPTPYPTPYPTPTPTPAPTYPTPYPTPLPTPSPTRIPTPSPTPPPTGWYEHPNANIPEEDRALLNVVDMLNDMVVKLEALLRSGSSEERLSWCQDMHKEMETVKAENAYVDEDPHKWALTEAQRELDWLCVNWQPEQRDQLPEHAQMMHEVLQMYEEKLTCFPGDIYCSPQGHIGGLKPNCHCACNAGWTGMACEEQR